MSNGMLRLIVSFASVDKLSGSLKGIVGLAQSGSQRLAGMKREARDLDGELRGVRAELGRSSGNVTALLERERSLEAQIASTNREMGQQVRLLKIQSKVDRMQARGDAMKSQGMDNLMGGAAMATPFIFAGRAAMSYEKQLNLIAQKTDMGEAATERFGRRILQVADQTSQAGDNLLKATDFLSGKGVAVSAIDAMMPAIGRFATAWDADVVDASKAAYAGFLSLKVPLSDTARSLEIMAAAGKAGGFEVRDMAQFFPQLTANLSTFGAKGLTAVADISAALQVIEAKTGDGATAANNLDNLMKFVKTKEGIKNFAKAGVDIPAALKKAEREGRSPLETLIKLIEKATGGDVSKIPQIIGDSQAGAAALALVDSQQRYMQIKAEAMKSLGMTEREYNRMAKGSEANFTRMTTALNTLTLTVGANLLPILTQGFQAVTRVVNAVSAWANANPQTAKTILTIVGSLALFKLGLGALQLVFGGLLGPMAKTIGFLWTHGPKLVTVFGGIRTAALFLARGVAQAGMIMLANPMVAVIVAIVAALGFAGYMVYKHWGTIKGAFMGALGWLRGLAGQFMSYGRALLDGLINGITSRIAAVKSMILGIAGKVAGWFRGVLGIRSPSRVFMGFGGHIAEGLAIGIDRSSGGAIGAAARMAQGIAATGLVTMGTAIAPAAASGGGGMAGGSGAMSFGSVTIQIYAQPGQNAGDIAEQVRRVLQEEESRRARAARSAYVDD
jgi:TP901 family phage tail tape measure protein